MSLSKYYGYGRIVNLTYKDEGNQQVMNISLSVRTSEKKKDSDEYPPTILVQGSLWGNRAAAMENILEKGQMIVISGSMGTPYSYEKDGEVKTILKLNQVDDIQLMTKDDSPVESQPRTVNPNTGQSSAAKAATRLELDDDDLYGESEYGF